MFFNALQPGKSYSTCNRFFDCKVSAVRIYPGSDWPYLSVELRQLEIRPGELSMHEGFLCNKQLITNKNNEFHFKLIDKCSACEMFTSKGKIPFISLKWECWQYDATVIISGK